MQPELTERDRIDPRYCTKCHKQVPWSMSAAHGTCDPCRGVTPNATPPPLPTGAPPPPLPPPLPAPPLPPAAPTVVTMDEAVTNLRVVLVAIGLLLVFALYHFAYVEPGMRRLARAAADQQTTIDTQREKIADLTVNLDELTRVVNHNADAANRNRFGY